MKFAPPITALGIKHGANHTGRLASIENCERCWVAQIAATVNPTVDCLHAAAGTFQTIL